MSTNGVLCMALSVLGRITLRLKLAFNAGSSMHGKALRALAGSKSVVAKLLKLELLLF